MDKLSHFEVQVADRRIQLEAGKLYLVSRNNDEFDKSIIAIWNSVVSTKHCLLEAFTESVIVIDLISEFGTFLNGKALPALERTKVFDGDTLEFGKDTGVTLSVMKRQMDTKRSINVNLRQSQNLSVDHSFVAETPDASIFSMQEDVDFENISVPETQDFPPRIESELPNLQFTTMGVDCSSLYDGGATVREANKENSRNIPINQLDEDHSPQPYDATFDDDLLTGTQLNKKYFQDDEETYDSEADMPNKWNDSTSTPGTSKICIINAEKAPKSSSITEKHNTSALKRSDGDPLSSSTPERSKMSISMARKAPQSSSITEPYESEEKHNFSALERDGVGATIREADKNHSQNITSTADNEDNNKSSQLMDSREKHNSPQPYEATADDELTAPTQLTDSRQGHNSPQPYEATADDELTAPTQLTDSRQGHNSPDPCEAAADDELTTPTQLTDSQIDRNFCENAEDAASCDPETSKTCGITKAEKETESTSIKDADESLAKEQNLFPDDAPGQNTVDSATNQADKEISASPSVPCASTSVNDGNSSGQLVPITQEQNRTASQQLLECNSPQPCEATADEDHGLTASMQLMDHDQMCQSAFASMRGEEEEEEDTDSDSHSFGHEIVGLSDTSIPLNNELFNKTQALLEAPYDSDEEVSEDEIRHLHARYLRAVEIGIVGEPKELMQADSGISNVYALSGEMTHNADTRVTSEKSNAGKYALKSTPSVSGVENQTTDEEEAPAASVEAENLPSGDWQSATELLNYAAFLLSEEPYRPTKEKRNAASDNAGNVGIASPSSEDLVEPKETKKLSNIELLERESLETEDVSNTANEKSSKALTTTHLASTSKMTAGSKEILSLPLSRKTRAQSRETGAPPPKRIAGLTSASTKVPKTTADSNDEPSRPLSRKTRAGSREAEAIDFTQETDATEPKRTTRLTSADMKAPNITTDSSGKLNLPLNRKSKRIDRLGSTSSKVPKTTSDSNEKASPPLSRRRTTRLASTTGKGTTSIKVPTPIKELHVSTAKKVAFKIEEPAVSGLYRKETSKEELNAKRTHSKFAHKSHIKIITTMVDPVRLEEFMKKSHGLWCIAEDPVDADLLVMDAGMRTFKFLLATAKGLPIVTSEWLQAVANRKMLVECKPYFFKNAEFEEKYNFKLGAEKEAGQHKLFEKHHFVYTENIVPTPYEIEEIIRGGGGAISASVPRSVPKGHQLYLISSDLDRKSFKKFQRAREGIKIIGTEGVMAAVMRHDTKQLDDHLLI